MDESKRRKERPSFEVDDDDDDYQNDDDNQGLTEEESKKLARYQDIHQFVRI